MTAEKKTPKQKIDLLLTGASQVITCTTVAGDHLGRLTGVTVAIQGEKIAAVGLLDDLERQFDVLSSVRFDVSRKILAPGFVDCHTHLVFGGSRAAEFGARMTHTAREVADMGIPSGIQATVNMTRERSMEELEAEAFVRLRNMLRAGTTTVESKSGYGLNTQKEIEMLRINRHLNQVQPVDIASTFLGAHDFPVEIPRDRYLDLLTEEMIPLIVDQNLAQFCDVYCDDGYYTVAETRRVLEAGQRYGLKPKLHVDAYANIGGSLLAAELMAVSADHLNYTTKAEVEQLTAAGVVGVVMPGLDFAVRHPRPVNARLMLDMGLNVALATDFCPGCWMESMQLVMQLACRQYQFTPEEALLAATVNAASAIGLSDRGSLEAGKLADIQVWDVPSFEDVIYRLGNNAVAKVIKRGKILSL